VRVRPDWRVALVDSLFPKQAAFVLSPAKTKIGQCTRRAGKTHGSGAMLFLAADRHPGSTALYLALTRKSAKRLLWPKLKSMARAYGIPATFNESDLTVSLPNGSQILLYGADQENMAERLRGDAYSIVVVDEGASFGENLEYTLTDVVEPALLDFQGTLAMVGSPGVILAGPFYDAATDASRGWEVHKWSVLDNPHLPHAERWIADLKRRRGWADDNPTYLREYMNVWTEDPDSLIYRFRPGVNEFSELPGNVSKWHHVLGVDLGFDDPAAWVVIAWSDECPAAYIVHAEKHQGWIPAQWAERTAELQKRYNVDETFADSGALGKAIVEEMRTRYGLAIEDAVKSDKMANIELMNGDFQSGRLFVHESLQEIKHQYRVLVKDRSGKREDPTLPNDLLDAALYPWRSSRPYWYRESVKGPEQGSLEWYEQQEKRQIERLERQSEQLRPWWERDELFA